jgi:hypothetical protein
MHTVKKFLASAVAIVLVAVASTSLRADTISLGANKDVTIFQSNVNNSGGGNDLFAGANGTSSPRRALIAFDIAGNIPAGAVIQGVQLTLTLGQLAGGGGGTGGPGGSPFVDLFRVSENWGEGTVQSGGAADSLAGQAQGAAGNEGDATWNAPCIPPQRQHSGRRPAAILLVPLAPACKFSAQLRTFRTHGYPL